MGHLFIICGPPGSGKTTLLKMIQDRQLPLKQLRRITTRPSRIEEGDQGSSNDEYEFLSREVFAERLAQGNALNFIDWNGNLYATDIRDIRKALDSEEDYLLYEDMPSAIHLMHNYAADVTVILLFTEDKDALLKVSFPTLLNSSNPAVTEWKRRLRLKYEKHKEAALAKGELPKPENEYLDEKLTRAVPDLAFMVGKILAKETVHVLANKRDQQEKTLQTFQEIVEGVKTNEMPIAGVFVLMPFRERFNKLYDFVIRPAVEGQGLRCERGDEILNNLEIMTDVVQRIEASELIITDITGGNPNVYFELGISMKLNKPILLISQDSNPAFYVRNYRCIRYENTKKGWRELDRQITDVVTRVKAGESILLQ